MKAFFVDIVSVERLEYEGEVVSLIAPSEAGYFGVLADHAPLLANLVPGKIFARETAGQEVSFYSKTKGFVEVFQNQVHILLDGPLEKIPGEKNDTERLREER